MVSVGSQWPIFASGIGAKPDEKRRDVVSPQICWNIIWILVSSFTPIRLPDFSHDWFSSSQFNHTSAVYTVSPYSDYGTNPNKRSACRHWNILIQRFYFPVCLFVHQEIQEPPSFFIYGNLHQCYINNKNTSDCSLSYVVYSN